MTKTLSIGHLEVASWLPSPILKQKTLVHLLPALAWLMIVTLFRWHWQFSFFNQIVSLLPFWIGGVLGTFFLDIEHLLYLLFIYPQELTSIRVKRLWQEKRIGEMLTMVMTTSDERIRLPFHNALFQPVLYVLCFFVLTSTGSLFGAGLVMAMALRLLKDEVECLLQGKDEFLRRWLFWQVKKEVPLSSQKAFVLVMLAVFVGLNLFLF